MKEVAWIDTGSDISLIKPEQYIKLGEPIFRNRMIKISGNRLG